MTLHNSWLEISGSALIHNIKIFKNLIGSDVQLFCVIKSNAYGHGMFEVAEVCDACEDVEKFCVAGLEEALELRASGIKKPVLVLSYYELNGRQIRDAVEKHITFTVYRKDQIDFLNKVAADLKRKAKVHLKFDSGTSRLGLDEEGILGLAVYAAKIGNIEIEGIFTHYASAEDIENPFNKEQTEKFEKVVQQLESKGIRIPVKHAACSAAALADSKYHFSAVRLGISLYGLWSIEDGQEIRKKHSLKPALSWKTKVIQIKELKAGNTVSYGRTLKIKKPTRIAVLPVGYWEGYDRKLSNVGEVLVGGGRCRVLGRICMNLVMVDITGKDILVGEEAVLIGRQGKEEITAEELAKKTKTINYEVVARINPKLHRKIID